VVIVVVGALTGVGANNDNLGMSGGGAMCRLVPAPTAEGAGGAIPLGNKGMVNCAWTPPVEMGLEGGMATRGLDEARGLEGMIPSRCHRGLDGVLRPPVGGL
jgi:hypothetical protein